MSELLKRIGSSIRSRYGRPCRIGHPGAGHDRRPHVVARPGQVDTERPVDAARDLGRAHSVPVAVPVERPLVAVPVAGGTSGRRCARARSRTSAPGRRRPSSRGPRADRDRLAQRPDARRDHQHENGAEHQRDEELRHRDSRTRGGRPGASTAPGGRRSHRPLPTGTELAGFSWAAGAGEEARRAEGEEERRTLASSVVGPETET